MTPIHFAGLIESAGHARAWNDMSPYERVRAISDDPDAPVSTAYHQRSWEELPDTIHSIIRRKVKPRTHASEAQQ